jgi:hypothetical protein
MIEPLGILTSISEVPFSVDILPAESGEKNI